MKYWVRHILFFSITAVLVLSVTFAADKTAESKEDMSVYSKPLKDDHADLQETVDTFQKPDTNAADLQQFKTKEKDIAEIYERYYGKADLPKQEPKEEKLRCENPADQPIKVDYYFSFSMPESSINAAVADAIALKKQCVEVQMRLRGFVDDDLKKTIKVFYNIAKANPEDLPVEIDPEGFKKNNIQQVPTVLVDGKRFVGDMRLAGIIRNLETLREGKVATSYAVKEEDIAEIFKRKAPLLEKAVRKYMASGAVEKKFNLTRYDGQFGKAEKKRVYYVDPTYTLQDDIVDQNGRVIMKAGMTFNPLDNMSLSKYIFINGNRPEEVELALKGNYRQIILVSGDVLELTRKYRTRFYHVNDQMIQLLRIERVPLMIEQEGKLIRATEHPI